MLFKNCFIEEDQIYNCEEFDQTNLIDYKSEMVFKGMKEQIKSVFRQINKILRKTFNLF